MKNKNYLFTLTHSFLISLGFILSVQASVFSLEFKADPILDIAQRQASQSKDLKIGFSLKDVSSDTSSNILNSEKMKQATGKPPNKGAPSDAQGSLASRGQCTQDSRIQSLTPASGSGAAMLETSTDLYFFIPQASIRPEVQGQKTEEEAVENIDEKETMTFSLINLVTGEKLYENQLDLALPALFNLDVTKANSPIVFEAGQTYQWTLTLNCDLTDTVSDYPSVSGSMLKVAVEPSIIAEGEAMDLGDRPSFYAQQGLQYDAIAALIELIQTEPDNPEIESIWQELLPEISLDVIKPALIQTVED
ncbi:MAG: DUF928 domain-containing protein [Limnothrix sp. RL_2_0]|nr:DUF928 domain-containing protein [Limnothrix sp. RL_2_0]